MHTYVENIMAGTWGVGFYICDDHWVELKDFKTEKEAAAYVNYLNGGSYDLLD